VHILILRISTESKQLPIMKKKDKIFKTINFSHVVPRLPL